MRVSEIRVKRIRVNQGLGVLTIGFWVIAAVIVRGKSKGSIAVVIQTIALAAFQIASTFCIYIAISLPSPTG